MELISEVTRCIQFHKEIATLLRNIPF